MIWNIKSEDERKIEVQQVGSNAWIVLEGKKQTYSGDGKGLEDKFNISNLPGITKTKLMDYFTPELEENKYKNKAKLEEAFSPEDYINFDEMLDDFIKDYGTVLNKNPMNYKEFNNLKVELGKEETIEKIVNKMREFTNNSPKWSKIVGKLKANKIEKMFVCAADEFI